MKRRSAGDGGPRGRRCCFGRRSRCRRARLHARRRWHDGTVPGVLHIHTNRSDGRGTPDEIAAAAARAGLKFVVFTDHGDATRDAGSAGLPIRRAVPRRRRDQHRRRPLRRARTCRQSPYPLAGEPRDVVEDVRRLGGFGIAAHPDSPKPELRWRDWTAPFDGVELINPDTSWRVHATRERARRQVAALAIAAGLSRTAGRSHRQLLTDTDALRDKWIATTTTGRSWRWPAPTRTPRCRYRRRARRQPVLGPVSELRRIARVAFGAREAGRTVFGRCAR